MSKSREGTSRQGRKQTAKRKSKSSFWKANSWLSISLAVSLIVVAFLLATLALPWPWLLAPAIGLVVLLVMYLRNPVARYFRLACTLVSAWMVLTLKSTSFDLGFVLGQHSGGLWYKIGEVPLFVRILLPTLSAICLLLDYKSRSSPATSERKKTSTELRYSLSRLNSYLMFLAFVLALLFTVVLVVFLNPWAVNAVRQQSDNAIIENIPVKATRQPPDGIPAPIRRGLQNVTPHLRSVLEAVWERSQTGDHPGIAQVFGLQDSAAVYRAVQNEELTQEVGLMFIRFGADAQYFSGCYEPAILMYKDALMTSKNDPVSDYSIGLCHAQLGRYRQAAWHFEAIKNRLDPSSKGHERLLAINRVHLGNALSQFDPQRGISEILGGIKDLENLKAESKRPILNEELGLSLQSSAEVSLGLLVASRPIDAALVEQMQDIEEIYRKALGMMKKTNHRANAFNRLGGIYRDRAIYADLLHLDGSRRDFLSAIDSYSAAIGLYETLEKHDPSLSRSIAVSYLMLGETRFRIRDLDQAQADLIKARQKYKARTNSSVELVYVLSALGAIKAERGDWAGASDTYAKAHAMLNSLERDDRLGENTREEIFASALSGFSWVLSNRPDRENGDPARALELAEKSFRLVEQVKTYRERYLISRAMSAAYRRLGKQQGSCEMASTGHRPSSVVQGRRRAQSVDTAVAIPFDLGSQTVDELLFVQVA